MLVIEAHTRRLGARARRSATLPRLTAGGIGVLVVGLAVDVVAHIHGSVPAAEDLGHLVVLAGMILALAGVLTLALGPGGARSREREERREP